MYKQWRGPRGQLPPQAPPKNLIDWVQQNFLTHVSVILLKTKINK